MYQTKTGLMLVALLTVFAAGPAAAGTLPDDNTYLAQVILYDNSISPTYRIIANYDSSDDVQYTVPDDILGRIIIGVNIGSEYCSFGEALSHTRVLFTISYNGDTLYSEYLDWHSTGGWGDGWRVVYEKENIEMVLIKDIRYTITTMYEIFTTSWVGVETWVDYLEIGEMPDVPGMPTTVPAMWLPIMTSFAVIAGMTFIGLNLSKSRDPTPGLFMLFAGIVLTWGVGWLPTWVFIAAIALLSMTSAALFGKLFKGR